MRRWIKTAVAAAAGLAAVVAASASVFEGSLRVAREGDGFRISWAGEAEPAGWRLLRGRVDELAAGRDETVVAEGLSEPRHLADPPAGSVYWFAEDGGASPSCNGSPALCPRRFDQVSYATTHNAMSSEQDGWILPNQTVDVPAQLDSGVRALMLDIHDFFGSPHLCHGTCLGGAQPLDEGLAEIRAFLDANPREVVALILECYSAVADVEAEFAAAGLLELCHEQPAGQPWPTLGEMIDANRRVVVLTDREGGSRPWYHDVWQHAWETHFSAETPADFSCDRNRGSAGNALFILNHFLTAPAASRALAEQVNYNPDFLDRALECEAASGSLPNFVTVDFHDVGDLFAVVDALNER